MKKTHVNFVFLNCTACFVLKDSSATLSQNKSSRTYITHSEVLILVLGVEPEPNFVVVLKQLVSVSLV